MKKRDASCEILENVEIAPRFYRMTVEMNNAENDFSAGQFFNLKVIPGRNEPLLRRPFAPSEVHADKMSFVYAVVGGGTEEIAKLRVGTEVEILYPLGNGFSIPENKETQCLLVGGGCGAPSMLALAIKLKEEGLAVHIAVGSKSQCSLLEITKMSDTADHVEVSTDDGSTGIKGHAVNAADIIYGNLDSSKPIQIFSCGPDPMLKGLTIFAADKNIPCEVSLEARMACGFGACVGCVVKVKDEKADEGFVYKKVCKDGPVFDAQSLIWE
ncbi:MAG: dihydroorotate dehydrogenase electron transfer subunit [Planctomycetota bacterium]|jgi:dihydroorotate dehydrogenase electron transfer subunit